MLLFNQHKLKERASQRLISILIMQNEQHKFTSEKLSSSSMKGCLFQQHYQGPSTDKKTSITENIVN